MSSTGEELQLRENKTLSDTSAGSPYIIDCYTTGYFKGYNPYCILIRKGYYINEYSALKRTIANDQNIKM